MICPGPFASLILKGRGKEGRKIVLAPRGRGPKLALIIRPSTVNKHKLRLE